MHAIVVFRSSTLTLRLCVKGTMILTHPSPWESGGRMSPHREVVTLAGHLSGMSQEVDCSVTAVRIWLSGRDVFEYSLAIPFDTPPDLPEGSSTLSFAGRTMPIHRNAEPWRTVRAGKG